jgi:hypothetical protein
MAKDFYVKAARAQYQALQTARAQALSELETAKQADDKWAAAQAVQQIADLASAEQNLARLVNQYQASQQPAPAQSEEERLAKPLERMNADDGLALARTSRYGKDLNWSDPLVQAGYQEAMRRRSRGE